MRGVRLLGTTQASHSRLETVLAVDSRIADSVVSRAFLQSGSEIDGARVQDAFFFAKASASGGAGALSWQLGAVQACLSISP